MYKNLYEKIVDALVCDGYVVINDALGLEFSSKLLHVAKDEVDFKKAGISTASNLHLDKNRRRDKILWLDKTNPKAADFLNFADGLKEYINKELYLGLSYYESHFAIYEKGDFYETHLDSFKNFKNRVVTTVYYLNEEWSDKDGGELMVYDEDNNFLAKVKPDADTLVVFMSEKFPHEVKPANKKRYSIAGWFRVDKR
ncbi:MAG: 2OG-Fe(II) oxygenase [Epsilonproteobacteria bacterium]|nr:2OG-Fe(II) oxygenase [Campylobacterota bacterium]